jgi:hypothetical protein
VSPSLLHDHAFLLLRRWREIVETPRFYFAEAGWFSIIWFYEGTAPLGALVHLWHLGKLSALCPQCDGRVLIHHLVGSGLSGGYWRGVCLGCHEEVQSEDLTREQLPSFARLWQPLVEAISQRQNEPEVEKGLRPRFDWGQGLVGIRTPDRVIRPRVDAVPLAAVTDILQDGPGRVPIRWPDGEVAFTFDWADQVLREPGGAEVLRLQAEAVCDAAGAVVRRWDSQYLRHPDGEIDVEVKRERASADRPDAPTLLGWRRTSGRWRTVAGPFDGAPLYEIRSSGIGPYGGTPILTFDDDIPVPIGLVLVERVRAGS